MARPLLALLIINPPGLHRPSGVNGLASAEGGNIYCGRDDGGAIIRRSAGRLIKTRCIAKANTRYIIRDACIERFARATSIVAGALLPGLATHRVVAGVGSIEFVLAWHDSSPPKGSTLHKVDNLDGKRVVCAVEFGGELGLAATGVGLAIEIDEFTLGVGGVAVGGVLGKNQDVITCEVLCPVSCDGLALDFCR